MRFIVISDLPNRRDTPELIFCLPYTMRYHDFRHGDLFPNPWFPAWCKIQPFYNIPAPDPVNIRRWCEQHCQGDVAFYADLQVNWLGFEYEQDAMSFSLTFSDIVVDQGVLEK